MARKLTEEQKIANRISQMVNVADLDLDEVGKTIANASSTLLYNRFILVAESAVEEKEKANANHIRY